MMDKLDTERRELRAEQIGTITNTVQEIVSESVTTICLDMKTLLVKGCLPVMNAKSSDSQKVASINNDGDTSGE